MNPADSDTNLHAFIQVLQPLAIFPAPHSSIFIKYRSIGKSEKQNESELVKIEEGHGVFSVT